MEDETRREALRLLEDSLRQAKADVAEITESLNGAWPIDCAHRPEFRAMRDRSRAWQALEEMP